MSNPNKTCFLPEPRDTNSFGSSVAINNKYFVVGDPGASKAIVYILDDSKKWVRTREILPPADLDLSEHSSIFGYGLELNGDILTINARTENPANKIASAHLPRLARIRDRYSGWRYLINLKTGTEVKLIKPLMKKEPDMVWFNLLRRDKIEQFVLPDMGEKLFGSDIALNRNLLLVGSPSYTEAGGAWLFDLEHLEVEPIKIVPENIDFATISFGGTVAVSHQFVAIGHNGRLWGTPVSMYPYPNNPHPFAKTLVKNLKNGSTKVIDSCGKLSLSKDILAVMRPGSPDWEQRPLLEVFYLDENATPHLIIRRTNVSDAWVQNGFLVFVKYLSDFRFSQVCIESLPKEN